MIPVTPAIAEPSTGETMGQSADTMAKLNGIAREDQDHFALRSHRLAAAGWKDGRLAAEVTPVYVGPRYEVAVTQDNGIREDSTYEQLAALRPVFDRGYGTVTAGNASPLTDGAAAVLLMREDVARALGYAPIAFIRAYAYAALDPAEQLLQAPALAAPVAMRRAGLALAIFGLPHRLARLDHRLLGGLEIGLGRKAFLAQRRHAFEARLGKAHVLPRGGNVGAGQRRVIAERDDIGLCAGNRGIGLGNL